MAQHCQFEYIFGEPKKHSAKQKHSPKHTTLKPEAFYSTNWRDIIKIRGASKAIWDATLQEKKDYGILVHTALASIKTEEDVERVLNEMYLDGLMDEEKKNELIGIIAEIISLPSLKPYFMTSVKIKTEAEIITEYGDSFRPDRIILDGQTATLIDYKTGDEKQEHQKQITHYAELLEAMNYTVDKKLLVYIEDRKVVEC